jgi:hypothetical protein
MGIVSADLSTYNITLERMEHEVMLVKAAQLFPDEPEAEPLEFWEMEENYERDQFVEMVSEKLIEEIGKGFLTGSRAYGIPNPDDEDRVFDFKSTEKIKSLIKILGIEEKPCSDAEMDPKYNGQNKSFKFVFEGREYNVISCPHGRAIDAWMFATECTKIGYERYPTYFSKKEKRVEFFKQIRDQFYTEGEL